MLRKFGRKLSAQGTEVWQDDILDKGENDGTSSRRSSEPSTFLSPSSPSPSVTRPRDVRHASFPDGRDPQYYGYTTSPTALDSLGLSLVHTCDYPIADIILVHGLGGSSHRSWSWERQPQNFWPAWLSQDAEVSRSRIFTFGYSAILGGPKSLLNILDFAKDLLLRMKTFSGHHGMADRPLGTYPIIFMMHSMGGLVVKKAYIIGRSDQQYRDIMSQIRVMLFLATPHRGSSYAEFLNNVLQTVPGYSPKDYVSELEKASTSLQDINEQFRTVCNGIKLASLYETYETPIVTVKGKAIVSKMVVDRESAILGYDGEMSSGLKADHHGIVKYDGTGDSNYVQVRDLVRMFMRDLISLSKQERQNWCSSNELTEFRTPAPRSSYKADVTFAEDKKRLEELFAIHDDPAEDYEIMRDQIMPGSCRWILKRWTYLNWKNLFQDKSSVLWITGLPAVGKSILSSFIIDDLQKELPREQCFYYFFKSGHQTKKTVSQMLRTLALQIATSNESFKARLLENFGADNFSFARQKLNTIWEVAFEGVLFRQQFDSPMFWIIDGLDEADDPAMLIKFLSKMQLRSCLRILIVSRHMREIPHTFDNNIELLRDEISPSDTAEDITTYAKSTLSTTLHSIEVQDDICAKVLQKAHGSFLWVKLTLDHIKNNWHTEDDINQALNDVPEGMVPLYERMMQTILNQDPRPRSIALRILTWAVCAFRPLELTELEAALSIEFGGFLSVADTLVQTCGNFVLVKRSTVTLIHETARHFLLNGPEAGPANINRRLGHEHIASTCLRFLMDRKKDWKKVLNSAQTRTQVSESHTGPQPTPVFDQNPFLSYSATWWAYHVSLSPGNADLHALILEFLDEYALIWIHCLALLRNLRALIRAAQYIKVYVKRIERKPSDETLLSLSGDRHDDLRQWVKDLMRVVGRYGNILTQNPQSIYRQILPFCPRQSIIRQTYPPMGSLSTVGISNDNWDDCLARLTMKNEEHATRVVCKGPYFLTLLGSGNIVIWHAESCEEARTIEPQEWMFVMECSRHSTLVAAAGPKTIRVWDSATGEELVRLPKLYDRKILALSFGIADQELFVAYDDPSIQCIDLTTEAEKFRLSLEEPGDLDHLCPHMVSFSPDNYHVLVAYRGKPMLAWCLETLSAGPQKCTRQEDQCHGHSDSTRAGTPECVVWRPDSAKALVLYTDNTIVEWDIDNDIQRETADTGAREMALSSDGNLLLTSDQNGTLSVWTVPEFRLTYQLQVSGMVRSIAFSPDGQRLYDIRGSYCNVWEPDVLIRPDDIDREDLSSVQETQYSEPSLSTDAPSRDQITSLVADEDDRYYCSGKDNGAVVLYDARNGDKVRKVYGHSAYVSIVQLTWSLSSKFIASADDSGRVVSKRLTKPTAQNPKWAVYPLLDFRTNEAVTQLLFSSSEEYLLVSSSACHFVWSLKDKKEVCKVVGLPRAATGWANHPLSRDRLLCFDTKEVREFSWLTLEEFRETVQEHDLKVPTISLSSVAEALPLQQSTIVVDAAFHALKTKIVFEASPISGSKQMQLAQRKIAVYDAAVSPQQGRMNRQHKTIKGLAGKVLRLVGCLNNGHVVYLDTQYCFCTWNLRNEPDRQGDIKRHFYLPKDWVNVEMLRLCTMNKFGTIFVPRNGEVAVIRSGIKI